MPSELLLLGLLLLALLVWVICSEEHGSINLSNGWIVLGGLVQIWIQILCVVRTGGRQVVYWTNFLELSLLC